MEQPDTTHISGKIPDGTAADAPATGAVASPASATSSAAGTQASGGPDAASAAAPEPVQGAAPAAVTAAPPVPGQGAGAASAQQEAADSEAGRPADNTRAPEEEQAAAQGVSGQTGAAAMDAMA